MNPVRRALLAYKKKLLVRYIYEASVPRDPLHAQYTTVQKHAARTAQRLISPELSEDILHFLKNHRGTYSKVFDVFWTQLESPHALRQISLIVRHFDYAVELGWLYETSASSLIMFALKEHYDLTVEQERALIRLEDSKWFKACTTTSSRSHAVKTYSPCVEEYVIHNPARVEEVIVMAANRTLSHAGQIAALLDGGSIPVLSDGAL